MLKPLFAIMARPSSRTTDHENALLEQALKTIWIKHQHAATVTYVAEWLLAHADPRAKDLGTMLFPYTKEGSMAVSLKVIAHSTRKILLLC